MSKQYWRSKKHWVRRKRNTGPIGNGDLGTCEGHHKVLFLSRSAARAVARKTGNPELSAFRCSDWPELWHLGHLPKMVRRGDARREDLK